MKQVSRVEKPHDLRHTAAKLRRDTGASIEDVGALLGHRSKPGQGLLVLLQQKFLYPFWTVITN